MQERSRPHSIVPGSPARAILSTDGRYRWLDIYTPELMREHYESFGTKELAPHIFALAADAYKALCVNGDSQCLVTSGESGSGKTENSKVRLLRRRQSVALNVQRVAERATRPSGPAHFTDTPTLWPHHLGHWTPPTRSTPPHPTRSKSSASLPRSLAYRQRTGQVA